MRVLIAIPVFNEERYVPRVIAHVLEYADDVLVIDDGSTDRTPELLARLSVDVIRHRRNLGYGRSIRDAFSWASASGYDWVITMDCDEQHEPRSIPMFVDMAAGRSGAMYDVVSGSRYLRRASDGDGDGDGELDPQNPPPDRQRINAQITREINDRLGLSLTDSFCGFKAYRVNALARLRLTESGYAFPMQFWVQAVAAGLRITEVPVKLIYNDLNRTFGGPLDDPTIRLSHYLRVLHCELERCAGLLPSVALEGVRAGCGKA